MNPSPILVQPPGLNLGDIYFILFRHKWRILLCTMAGIVTAGLVYKLNPPPYFSDAKLFVRYVISESQRIGQATRDSATKSPDERGETIMKSETEILTSLDLARQVAESIGPEKILEKAGGGKDVTQAQALIRANLTTAITPGSTVIHVGFRHPDPAMVQIVLREIIDKYFKLHMETHTATGLLGDFLSQETDQMRSRLSQTEEELRKASNKAGIISLEEAKKSYAEQIAAIRRDLFSAHADLAQRSSLLQELTQKKSPSDAPAEAETPIPDAALREHRASLQRLDSLRKMEEDLLTQFTEESTRVIEVRSLINDVETSLRKLHEKYPKLAKITPPSQRPTNPIDVIDPSTVKAQVAALEARVKVLNGQLDQLRAESGKVDQMEGAIVELRRKKELQESNYRNYAASLEQSRLNETLGNGRVSNITAIQTPSPAFSDRSKSLKIVGLILAGGFIIGIGWSFLIELYFDRTIKRAVDVERALSIPLFLEIPKLKSKYMLAAPKLMLPGPGKVAANGANGHAPVKGDGPTPNGRAPAESAALAAADTAHPLQVFHDTLRDRLIGYFDSINLTHKPKLVAVAGLRAEAGVSTTAAGLARSLSETGEGNVLLVDMNVGRGVAQQFLNGKAVCGIDELLDARHNAHVDENLYVVAESHSDRLSRNMPQRFSKLVPKLKASDFDYIIFDMPAISQISITPRLAGFMDMVLLVIESEKTDRELVQRAASLLADSRAHVGAVLNKTKGYVPLGLYQDTLAN